MKVLVIGAGVVGTVYGAQLGEAGNAISILAHGLRTESIARDGLTAHDVLTGAVAHSPAAVVDDVREGTFDVALVALRRDDLAAISVQLDQLLGQPLTVFFGNNPQGADGLPRGLPGAVAMGFPGIGGTMANDIGPFCCVRG